MTDECNRKSIMVYVFLNCPVRDDTIHSNIINEAMDALKTRGYLYVNEIDSIIDKYCPPPKKLIAGWDYEGIAIPEEYKEFESLL